MKWTVDPGADYHTEGGDVTHLSRTERIIAELRRHADFIDRTGSGGVELHWTEHKPGVHVRCILSTRVAENVREDAA